MALMKLTLTKKGYSDVLDAATLKSLGAAVGVGIKRSSQVTSIMMEAKGTPKQLEMFAKVLRKQVPGSRISSKASVSKEDCVKCKPMYVFNANSDRCIKVLGKRAKKLGLSKAYKGPMPPDAKKKVQAVKAQSTVFRDIVDSTFKKLKINTMPNTKTSNTKKQNTVLVNVRGNSAIAQARVKVQPFGPPPPSEAVRGRNCVNTKLFGKEFVFTGFRNLKVERQIVDCGGVIGKNVTRRTNYLIYNDTAAMNTPKFKDAMRLDVKRVLFKTLTEKTGLQA